MTSGRGCKGASKEGSPFVKLVFFRVVVLLVGIGKKALDSLACTAVVQDKSLGESRSVVIDLLVRN